MAIAASVAGPITVGALLVLGVATTGALLVPRTAHAPKRAFILSCLLPSIAILGWLSIQFLGGCGFDSFSERCSNSRDLEFLFWPAVILPPLGAGFVDKRISRTLWLLGGLSVSAALVAFLVGSDLPPGNPSLS